MTLTGTWVWSPGNFGWYESPGQVSTDNETWVSASYLAICCSGLVPATADGVSVKVRRGLVGV